MGIPIENLSLTAAIDFIEGKIVAAEKTLKTREEMYKTWREGTDASWRKSGCLNSKSERIKISDTHGRIAIKNRRDLEMFRAVKKHLQMP